MRSFFAVIAALMVSALIPVTQAQTTQSNPFGDQPAPPVIITSAEGSTYVPMDSWIYPELDRLHSLGFLDTAFLGLRPWTRLSIAHMLEESADAIDNSDDEQAKEIYLAVLDEVQPDIDNATTLTHPGAQLGSVYQDFRGIDGTVLRDSFHLGQSIIDDYGRPDQGGFNDYTGFSARAEAGRFSLYYRGEYQHAPGATGYSLPLAEDLSVIDQIPFATNMHQPTIPEGPIPVANDSRAMEATLSFHLLGHELSFGKSDHWMAPDRGASMLWSDNAENIYQFQIDRVEPLRVPLLSRVTGPFRYDFAVGSLKGHTDPNDPWVHVEKINFKPTRNLEFGFSRMVIWGGKGHEPITLHTFLKSFFSFQNVAAKSTKFSANDPGARFGTFDFDYRLPFLRNWVTLYTDSLVHDDVSPISAPRRAGVHPGIYLARFPGLQQLSLRVEGANTNTVSSANLGGHFLYTEAVQKQGPTNQGFLLGDWIGRQAKGGQAWLTYHLSAKSNVEFMYRNMKINGDFFPGGTTQNDFQGSVREWVAHDIEIGGLVRYEGWKAPILTYPVFTSTLHSDTTAEVRITWYPRQHAQ